MSEAQPPSPEGDDDYSQRAAFFCRTAAAMAMTGQCVAVAVIVQLPNHNLVMAMQGRHDEACLREFQRVAAGMLIEAHTPTPGEHVH